MSHGPGLHGEAGGVDSSVAVADAVVWSKPIVGAEPVAVCSGVVEEHVIQTVFAWSEAASTLTGAGSHEE